MTAKPSDETFGTGNGRSAWEKGLKAAESLGALTFQSPSRFWDFSHDFLAWKIANHAVSLKGMSGSVARSLK